MSERASESLGMSRRVLYIVAAAVVAVLIVTGLLTWQADARDGARDKARALVTAICADPNQALVRAGMLAGLSNGAGGPGTRPVITPERVVRGELTIISSYCPEKLPAFQQFLDGLETSG